MANYFGFDKSGETKVPSYDLREIYARLLGEHLIDAAIARKSNNFYNYYFALEDIKTIIAHKIKNFSEYNLLKKEIVDLSIKYPQTWLGQSEDFKANIDIALRKLEEYLYKKLDECGLLGTKSSDDGL